MNRILFASGLALLIVAPLLHPLPCSAQTGDILCGSWSGSWVSCQTGHRGRLSATFCRTGPNQVQANFRGTFAKIIPFRYRPTLTIVHEEPGLVILEGCQRIPLGGSFQYRATVTPGQFRATYQSRRDQGQWNMQR